MRIESTKKILADIEVRRINGNFEEDVLAQEKELRCHFMIPLKSIIFVSGGSEKSGLSKGHDIHFLICIQ